MQAKNTRAVVENVSKPFRSRTSPAGDREDVLRTLFVLTHQSPVLYLICCKFHFATSKPGIGRCTSPRGLNNRSTIHFKTWSRCIVPGTFFSGISNPGRAHFLE